MIIVIKANPEQRKMLLYFLFLIRRLNKTNNIENKEFSRKSAHLKEDFRKIRSIKDAIAG
jgi:hypothetical protein